MWRNLESGGGLIFSGTVLLELARKGVSREEAYAWVQAAALQAGAGGSDFRALLKKNPSVARHLTAREIDRCFDLDHQLRHVDALFERTFGRA
jgi:adenylosuccinate lyase